MMSHDIFSDRTETAEAIETYTPVGGAVAVLKEIATQARRIRGLVGSAGRIEPEPSPSLSAPEWPRARFAIICMGRSGSTLLQTMLDSHPDIRCFGELFIPKGPFEQSGEPSAADFIDDELKRQSQPVVGFKMPWSSLIPHPEVIDVFRHQQFRVILLIRRNKLDQYLSMQLAVKNNVWHSFDGIYEDERLHIDVDHCIENLEYFRFGEAMWREIMRGLRGTEIAYEQLVNQQGLEPVFKLLEVEPQVLTPGVARLRQGTQRDIVENYDELKERLRGTPWECDLEE